MSYKTIQRQTCTTRNGWKHDEYRDYGNGSFQRVEIAIDYEEGSEIAAVYHWNITNGWLFVLSLPLSSTPVADVGIIDSDANVALLEETADLLFSQARKILR
jgi:hypothetical protein